jgi:pimeloyl-ACP methyl ester carboxylesterase
MAKSSGPVLHSFRAKMAALALTGMLLTPALGTGLSQSTDGPRSAFLASGSPAAAPTSPTIVIGFLGGLVRHDDPVHSTVQLAEKLRKEYPGGVHIETFENRRREDARKTILRLLGTDKNGKLTEEEKMRARVILYGHSWGASAVVTLAKELEQDKIPVLLTVQVDSVAKGDQDDSVIPANVARAANFYQPDGLLHGRQTITAADPARTQILGNFRFSYKEAPVACQGYPWYYKFFWKTHMEIECDPHVWLQVETLIREQLDQTTAQKTNASK